MPNPAFHRAVSRPLAGLLLWSAGLAGAAASPLATTAPAALQAGASPATAITVPPAAPPAAPTATQVQPIAVGNGPATVAPLRPADSPLPADLENTLRVQLQQLALTGSQSLPGVKRVDIEVGQLDPRLRLAPCQRVEPYIPNGTRLWGKARIGLRCTQGPTPWNVYLPITVRVFGNAWVAVNALPAGTVIGPTDLVQGEVDWADEASPVLADADQAIGRTLARRLAAGQGVRSGDLKSRQWFAAGDTVKLVAIGPGFTVTSSGQALNAGLEGQPVRVRVSDADNTRSRVVTGTAAGDRMVEIRP